jgi:hypothetical protein
VLQIKHLPEGLDLQDHGYGHVPWPGISGNVNVVFAVCVFIAGATAVAVFSRSETKLL